MTHKRNTDGLSQSAQQKSESTLERTNKAISQLVKLGKTINFHTVALAAGVSVAYLYKHEEIKQRIDQLRSQQSSIKGLPQKLGASDDSKKTVNTTLKLRTRELESEVRGLRNHIEVIQGIALQVPDLDQEIEALRAENSKINVQLNELSLENSRLREQLNTYTVSNSLEQSVAPKSKVTSLADKKSAQSGVSDKIKAQLALVKIRLNSTLTERIKIAASEEVVLSAIEALKEAMTNENIEKPEAWLNRAIKSGWMPSEKHLNKVDHDIFSEWFNLAKQQGLIMASMKGDDGRLYVFTRGGEQLPFEQMLAEHPVDVLRRRLESSTL